MIANITSKPIPIARTRGDVLESYYLLAEPIISLAKILYEIVRDSSHSTYWQTVDRNIKRILADRLWCLEKANQFKNELWCNENHFDGVSEFIRKCLFSAELSVEEYLSDPHQFSTAKFIDISTDKNSEVEVSQLTARSCSRTATFLSGAPSSNPSNFETLRRKIISKFKYRERTRFLKVEFSEDLNDTDIQVMNEYLKTKRAAAHAVDKKVFVIKFTGDDVNKFTRRYGYLQTLQKKIKLSIKSHQSGGKSFFGQPEKSSFHIISASLQKLAKFGSISGGEIRKFILRAVRNQSEIPLTKRLIKRLKNKTKNEARKTRQQNSVDSVVGFENENLFKYESHLDGKTIRFYYSQEVIKFIQNGQFDLIFVDGTHLKMLKKNQVTIVRFYSTKSAKVITGLYILNPSKKAKSYAVIFDFIQKLGLLTHCKFLTTDFELAIRKGFEEVISSPVAFRYCFFHLVSATRKYSASINKTIAMENQHWGKNHCPTLPHIFRLFSFLIFIRKPLQSMMFRVFKHLVRNHAFNLANELFMAYFRSTYINGPLSKHFFLGFEHTSIITNNFVEGINSSLKRHNRGKVNIDTFLDWLKIDSKKSVMDLDENIVTHPKSNSRFKKFSEMFEAHGDCLGVFLDYTAELSRNRSKTKDSTKQNGKSNDFQKFANCIRNARIEWTEESMTVFHQNELVFRTWANQSDHDNDLEYWSQLGDDFDIYLKRLRQK